MTIIKDDIGWAGRTFLGAALLCGAFAAGGCGDDEKTLPVASGSSTSEDPSTATAAAVNQMMTKLGQDPALVIVVSVGGKHDPEAIRKKLDSVLPKKTKVWGYTSLSKGAFTPGGFEPSVVTVMGLAYSGMEVGIGSAPWEKGVEASGSDAIEAALADAGKSAQDRPKFVLFTGPQGVHEQAAINGMQTILGEVPVYGGNATGPRSPDGDIDQYEGTQYTRDAVSDHDVVVAAVYGNIKASITYGYGHDEETDHVATIVQTDPVTQVVTTVDDGTGERPLVEVLNEWRAGIFDEVIDSERAEADCTEVGASFTGGACHRNLLVEAAASDGPIGMPKEIFAAKAYKKALTSDLAGDFNLISAVDLRSNGAMFVCCDGAQAGTAITQTSFEPSKVAGLAGSLVGVARNSAGIAKDDIAGALFLYCDSQFLIDPALQDEVVDPFLSAAGDDTPFIGSMNSGEVGYTPAVGGRFLTFSGVVLVLGKE